MVETLDRAQVKILFLTSMLVLVGCATPDSNRTIHISESDYVSAVNGVTKESKTYEGLVNTIDVKITPLVSQIREAQTLKKATNFQWGPDEIAKDRDFNIKSMASETKFFMSFYTPERKDDNLNKADTVWRIFLDVEGRRYPGTVQKMTDTPSEISDLYPDHTKWGTPYMVKFLVPTRLIEDGESTLTLTGPVGSTTIVFKNLKGR